MVIDVKMPQLGESVTEGTVTKWLVKEGDVIKKDQPLLEVATDKGRIAYGPVSAADVPALFAADFLVSGFFFSVGAAGGRRNFRFRCGLFIDLSWPAVSTISRS